MRLLILPTTLVLLGVSACGHHDSPAAVPPTVVPGACLTSIVVTPSSSTLRIADTVRLAASACSVNSDDWWWFSSNTAVATVDSVGGLVRAKSSGVASIIAQALRDPSVKGAGIVTVTP